MKTRLAILVLLTVSLKGVCIPYTNPPENGFNYVVIGAFSVQKNAQHFVELAKKFQLHAEFEINPNRNLYYVYVLQTGNREIAIEEARKLRNQQLYNDTWVYSGYLGKNAQMFEGRDINPSSEEMMMSVQSEQVVATSQPVVETVVTENSPIVEAIPESATVEDNASRFFFKIFKSATGQPVNGEVDVVDPEKQKKISSYNGNTSVKISPVNKTGQLLLQCQVFGYRKISHAIDLTNPASIEGASIENKQVVVPFELVRLKKGDYSVMYNVYFFKDAAVMRPESRYEVTALLEMLQENPKYKIRIHGHTNGKSAGKIISVGDDQNFFSLTGTKEGFGSAKKLSEERANLIRDFLISEGIGANRLEVKAWGGKKPVYAKDHAQAHANVRVEIEIVEE